MTKEEKQLLLKDLCSRLPYKPKVHIEHDVFYDEREPYDTELSLSVLYNRCAGMEIKPYLRPMSSMTTEEHDYYNNNLITNAITICEEKLSDYLEFMHSHHFDYNKLIEKGLALEAPKGMYKF